MRIDSKTRKRLAPGWVLIMAGALAGCAAEPGDAAVTEALVSAATTMRGGFDEHDVVLVERTLHDDGSMVLVEESVLDFTGALVGTAEARTVRLVDPTGADQMYRTLLLIGRYGRAPVTLSLAMAGSGSGGSLLVLQGSEGTTPLAGQGTFDVLGGTWVLEALPPDIGITFRNDHSGEILVGHVERDAQGEPRRVVIAPRLTITNPLPTPITVERVEVFSEPGHQLVATWEWDVPTPLAGYETREIDATVDGVPGNGASDGERGNVFLDGAAPPELSFAIKLVGGSFEHYAARALAGWVNAPPAGSYRFPARYEDLPADTYWSGSTSHSGGNQRYGYDLGAVRWVTGNWESHVDDGDRLDEYFAWHLPVYAMAAGEVVECVSGIADNTTPLVDHQAIDPNIPSGGNYIIIRTGNELLKYSHFAANSIDSVLCQANVWVPQGQHLGDVGNTGTSAPHLHVHVISDAPYYDMLPLALHGADIVRRSLVSHDALDEAPWVTLGGRMLPEDAVLIRPGVPRCGGLAATVVGSEGDDEMFGTPGIDVIVGGEGVDLIDGAGGDDIICGGGGSDELYGGDGSDLVYGGAGDDLAYGDAGGSAFGAADILFGGAGDDFLYGEDGDDTIYGDEDHDVLEGGLGDDALEGGGGADVVRGQSGSDLLSGGAGQTDWCEGGDGTDALTPGDGCEEIHQVP